MDQNWRTITESEFPWEREALAFIRRLLPDDERVHAWANFEMVTRDGRIYEQDLLVVTPAGVFLVEIKSWPGRISGDAGTWTWHHGGLERTYDNPRLITNRKAKILKSLLVGRPEMKKFRQQLFIEALVFLSDPDLRLDLDERARQGVWLRDREASDGVRARSGIVRAMTELRGRPRVDRPMARALVKAVEGIGIRPSQRVTRFGDYRLQELLHETETYQEWKVEKTSIAGLVRRARLYPLAPDASQELRERRDRAARREFSFLRDLQHPGILWPVDFHEDDRGPVVLFDHDGDGLRFDHFVKQEHHRLSLDQRLDMARQLFEAVAFAHDKGLIHRALSPRAVTVSEKRGRLRVLVGDWQEGRRQLSTGHGSMLDATDHVGRDLEALDRLYLAPEVWTQQRIAEFDEPSLDVFSLGVLAYHLFAGGPPALDFADMQTRLKEGPGLQLSSVVDGAVMSLQMLVCDATHPDVTGRTPAVRDLLEALEEVEEELTAPDASSFVDPKHAKGRDRLAGGYQVVRVLGSGATARVFEVEVPGPSTDRESVLKVALDPEHNDRLVDEMEVLEQLRHSHVVAPRALVDVGEHKGILMESAGSQTLERRLREEGALDVDDLRRLGDELLQVVEHLEEKGIAHRDLKPSNMGLCRRGQGRTHLVVFDFSLSRVPVDRVRAGTVGYVDPFLRTAERGRWDVHAERFAAAVTLYESATGSRPVWGDGRSDPALATDATPRVEVEQFSELGEGAAEALREFFLRALSPDYRDRFDTCEDMLQAWRAAFLVRANSPRSMEQIDPERSGVAEGARSSRGPTGQIPESWKDASLETPVEALHLAKRSLRALDRAGARTVSDVLGLQLDDLAGQRNVGVKTRQELARLLEALRERFPDFVSVAEPEAGEEDLAEVGAWSLDRLAQPLIPASRRKDSKEPETLALLLGLEEGSAGGKPTAWPSQSEVAEWLGVTRAAIGQKTVKARERWRRQKALTALRADISNHLALHGGVMALDELVRLLLLLRGSTLRGEARRRVASAVARAAVETESTLDEPKFSVWRRGGDVFFTTAGAAGPGPRWADCARSLGRRADQLAAEQPLPSASRVLEELSRVSLPEDLSLDPDRLLSLAAAASETAALSPRGELYPKAMSPQQAVELAQGALLGARRLDVVGTHRRIRGRFPEIGPLPGRKELDRLLEQAGTGLRWIPTGEGLEQGYYQSELPQGGTVSSLSGEGLSDAGLSPDSTRFEERLAKSSANGDFLVLPVAPRRAERVARQLGERFEVTSLSLDQLLIEAMRAEAKTAGAEWDVVLEADAAARDSEDWEILVKLVRDRALPRVERTLAEHRGTALVTHPGLLARYGCLSFLERLRVRSGPDLGFWILVPTGDTQGRPRIDGQALPLVPGEWLTVPRGWPVG